MVVSVVVCDLHLPQARSLKEKRKVLQSIIARLSTQHRVSVAETDHQDLHQRIQLGMAAVDRSVAMAERRTERIRDLIEGYPEVVITRWSCEFVEDLG